MIILFGIFILLHGLVHFTYIGHSIRAFELPGLAWPDESWALSWLPGPNTARALVAVLLSLALIGFVVAGIGLLARQAWWDAFAIGAAAISALVFILCWNGTTKGLTTQGGLGVLINLAILAALLVFRWKPV